MTDLTMTSETDMLPLGIIIHLYVQIFWCLHSFRCIYLTYPHVNLGKKLNRSAAYINIGTCKVGALMSM